MKPSHLLCALFLATLLVALLPAPAPAQADTVTVVDTMATTSAAPDTSVVNSVSRFVQSFLVALLPGFPETAAVLVGDLLGTVACAFPVVPVVWLLGLVSGWLLKLLPGLAAKVAPHWAKVKWWAIPLLAAIGSHFAFGSAAVGLAAAAVKKVLTMALPATTAALKKTTPEGIGHAGQVGLVALLGLMLLAGTATAAGKAQPRPAFAVGPVLLQERVGPGERLQLKGAVKLLAGWTFTDHVGARAFVTQPFTEGALKKPRPQLEAGLFLVW